MNTLYCGDKNIEKGLTLSVLSLLKNVKEVLKIYVLTAEIQDMNVNSISDKSIFNLNILVQKCNKDNFIKKIDVTTIFKENLPLINMSTRFTPCSMLRLLADKVDEIPDKILYLDTDVMARKNPAEFYNMDITSYEIVGSLDYYGRWFFKKNIFKMDYINSGVLLLNMKKIRETLLFEKCIELCKKKKMFMPDQSAINKLAKSKKIVPRKYNEQRKLSEDTVFQHFTTTFKYFPYIRPYTVKPWEIDRVHKELKNFDYDDIYMQYKKINF